VRKVYHGLIFLVHSWLELSHGCTISSKNRPFNGAQKYNNRINFCEICHNNLASGILFDVDVGEYKSIFKIDHFTAVREVSRLLALRTY
jgi:hypothetical protein